MLLHYHAGKTVSEIASMLGTNRPGVEQRLRKALKRGVVQALADLPDRCRRPAITPQARAWVVSLACQKAKELGYAQELWTTALLTQHARRHGAAAGYPNLAKLGRGTVSKILGANRACPHKIRYYLKRRDPNLDTKMVQVLNVYNQVEIWRL